MPPSVYNLNLQRQTRHSEAAPVKTWLIGRMNRKADILPIELVHRMMEMYNIHEDELDPRMAENFRAGVEDEGVSLNEPE
jgi:hypothetical protein